MDDLLLDIYTIEQALIFLKNKRLLINDASAIYQLADEGKIKLCVVVRECQYCRMRTLSNRFFASIYVHLLNFILMTEKLKLSLLLDAFLATSRDQPGGQFNGLPARRCK